MHRLRANQDRKDKPDKFLNVEHKRDDSAFANEALDAPDCGPV
jgi:hypothetical protein